MRPELFNPDLLLYHIEHETKFDAKLLGQIIDEWKAYKATGLEPEEIIVPPCKVGDTVYYMDKYRHKIEPIRILDYCVNYNGLSEIGCFGNGYTPIRFYPEDIGKTVFLTEKEANAALSLAKDNDSQFYVKDV